MFCYSISNIKTVYHTMIEERSMDKNLLIRSIFEHQIRNDLLDIKVGDNVEVITKVLDKKDPKKSLKSINVVINHLLKKLLMRFF